jgi:hypothetical protein
MDIFTLAQGWQKGAIPATTWKVSFEAISRQDFK